MNTLGTVLLLRYMVEFIQFKVSYTFNSELTTFFLLQQKAHYEFSAILFSYILVKLQIHFFSTQLYLGVESPHGVVENILDCDIVISKFKFYLCYYVHFWTNTLWKGSHSLISPCPVGWGCRIHQLLLRRGVRLTRPQWVSWMWHKTIFIAIASRFTLTWSGSTWEGPIYESNRTVLMLNWIAWNRTVLAFKLRTYAKLVFVW